MTAGDYPRAASPTRRSGRGVRPVRRRRALDGRPRDGEVSVPLFISPSGDRITVACTKKPGRRVARHPRAGQGVHLHGRRRAGNGPGPGGFRRDRVRRPRVQSLLPEHRGALRPQIERAGRRADRRRSARSWTKTRARCTWRCGYRWAGRVRAGEANLRFDVLAGYQLFVDSVSDQFIRPRVGQGFVFRTDHIPEIERAYGTSTS